MIVLLYLFALSLIAGGVATFFIGSDPRLLSYGQTLMIVGSIGAVGGLILAALAAIYGRLGRLVDALDVFGDVMGNRPRVPVEAAPSQPAPAVAVVPASAAPAAPSSVMPAAAAVVAGGAMVAGAVALANTGTSAPPEREPFPEKPEETLELPFETAVQPIPLSAPDAPPPTLASIEAELERALMASFSAAPLPVEPSVEPEAQALDLSEPEPRVVAEPEPPAEVEAETGGLDALAREFPELGDILTSPPAMPEAVDAPEMIEVVAPDPIESEPAQSEPEMEPHLPPAPQLEMVSVPPETVIEPPLIPAQPPPPLLREGVIAGVTFRLYGDGSIEADLPEGTTRFESLRAFRSHVGG